MIRKGRIPKTNRGDYWHWKDFNVGQDVCFYGIVFHTVDCDTFTREYMLSQGLVMKEAEEMPPDPCMQDRMFYEITHQTVPKSDDATDDKLRRFLEYDGKILK